MLLLLTLIGLTGMRVSTLEEKMAGNTKEMNLSFQAAETVLRGVERKISDPTEFAALKASKGYFPVFEFKKGVQLWEPDGLQASASNVYSLSLGGSTGPQARYIVEELPKAPGIGGDITDYQNFRITTQVVGPTGTAEVILQSIYRR
jgi:type IV pilus assembly protein PilX